MDNRRSHSLAAPLTRALRHQPPVSALAAEQAIHSFSLEAGVGKKTEGKKDLRGLNVGLSAIGIHLKAR